MAFYKRIKDYKDFEFIDGTTFPYPDKKSKIAQNLRRLRNDIRAQITRQKHDSLVIGSWNIQNFDNGLPRLDESYHYIAEVIDHFDICAIQEVNDDLSGLVRVTKLLGPHWDYFVSDVTLGDGGNSERMAFVYNTNKVFFRNLIGEVIPEGDTIARNPFFASFQAGWFRFTLCSSHVTFDGNLNKRRAEILAVSNVLEKRASKQRDVFIFLGDMNIKENDDTVFQQMRANGWDVRDFENTTTGKSSSAYDKINFTKDVNRVEHLNHGKYDWRNSVFREQDKSFYETIKFAQRGKGFGDHHMSDYRHWYSLEMSDHFPIWLELETDYSDAYLEEIENG